MAQQDHTVSSLLEILSKIKDQYGDIPVVISGGDRFFIQLHGDPKIVKVTQDLDTEFFYPAAEPLDGVVCVLRCEDI